MNIYESIEAVAQKIGQPFTNDLNIMVLTVHNNLILTRPCLLSKLSLIKMS